MKPKTDENESEVSHLRLKANSIDAELVEWAGSLPKHWMYKQMAFVEEDSGEELKTASSYPGRIDTYQDLSIAGIWNSYRVFRTSMLGVIVRCTAWLTSPQPYQRAPEVLRASQLVSQLVDEICASVPFHLGQSMSKSKNKSPDPTGNLPRETEGYHNCGPRALGGFFLLWPLTTAATCDSTSLRQRDWILGRLSFISENMGVLQADLASKVRMFFLINVSLSDHVS
jgi:hypothetical protein